MTNDQERLLYDDPYYGLGLYNEDGTENYLPYVYWNRLLETDDETAKLEQLAWYWELRTYFGLSFEQVQEMKSNWHQYYSRGYNEVVEILPSPIESFRNKFGVAYWQWADSHMTES